MKEGNYLLFGKVEESKNSKYDYFIFTLISLITTLCAFGLSYIGISETNIVMIYILSVILTARYTRGYRYGLIQTVISILLYNLFFIQPYFSFSVYNKEYLVTFLIMGVTSLAISSLTLRERRLRDEAMRREHETKTLYMLNRGLIKTNSQADMEQMIVDLVSEIMNCDVALVHFDQHKIANRVFIQKNKQGHIHRKLENNIEYSQRIHHLEGDYLIDDQCYNYKIYSDSKIFGVLRLPVSVMDSLDETERDLFKIILMNIALSLDRFNILEDKIRSDEKAIREMDKATMLRAISHDFRTPLAGILGTCEMLEDDLTLQDSQRLLVQDIYHETEYLHSLLENILSLTRMQSEQVSIQREYEDLEDSLALALRVINKKYPHREIQVVLPSSPIILPMDAKLISQVFINLLDNAIKHTKPNEEIKIEVCETDQEVIISVIDCGEGIDVKDLDRVFETFFIGRKQRESQHKSMGIGLALCKTIIHLHQGVITIKNREKQSGVQVEFRLPKAGGINAR